MSWISYLKMLWKGKKAVNEAIAQGHIVKDVHSKVGWKSTEFWVSVLAALGAILAQAGGIVPAPYGAILASASGAFYQVSRGLAKSGDSLGGVKPGPATTEFWVNLLAQAGGVAAATAGAVAPETAAILMLVSNGAYGLSRGLAKGGAQPS